MSDFWDWVNRIIFCIICIVIICLFVWWLGWLVPWSWHLIGFGFLTLVFGALCGNNAGINASGRWRG